MEETKKQLVCNDCGCRFEAKAKKDGGAGGKPVVPPEPVSCPKCKGLDVTTA